MSAITAWAAEADGAKAVGEPLPLTGAERAHVIAVIQKGLDTRPDVTAYL